MFLFDPGFSGSSDHTKCYGIQILMVIDEWSILNYLRNKFNGIILQCKKNGLRLPDYINKKVIKKTTFYKIPAVRYK